MLQLVAHVGTVSHVPPPSDSEAGVACMEKRMLRAAKGAASTTTGASEQTAPQPMGEAGLASLSQGRLRGPTRTHTSAAEGEGEAEPVAGLVLVIVLVHVMALVLVIVLVLVMVLVGDMELVIEALGAGERRVAMLRPRKVMAAMTASASPASHRLDSNTPLSMALLGMSCVMLTSRKQLEGPPARKDGSPAAKE